MAQPLFDADEWDRIVCALGLTKRKAQIAALLLEGRTDDAIAKALGIGKPTLRTHLGQMSQQLGVTGRLGLAVKIFHTARHALHDPSDHHQR